MDYITKMKYGTEKVEIAVKGAKSVEVLDTVPMPEIKDTEEAFRKCVEEEAICSGPLKEKISADDKVTIVVSDITRSWMHQGDIITLLGHYLHDDIGVSFENIVVLIAIGTHRKSEEQEKEIIAGSYMYEKVQVLDHDCDGETVYVGTTSRGTEVWVNPLVIGRKVIVVGGTVHHMMAGFGGGRKNILPGVASRKTIRQNHERALDPNIAHSDPRVGCALLENNPINEDMNEAAAFVDVAYGINIVVATSGRYSGLFGGDLYEAWKESCTFQKKCYEKWIDEEADIVIVSSGGAPNDMSLYQGCKGMLNGIRAMKEGGQMIWLAKCPEGCGAPDYTDWFQPLNEGRLDPALRDNFTIGGFIFYLTVENLKKGKCRVLTTIDNETLQPMGMTAYSDVSELMRGVSFADKKVYIIPYGGSVVPMVRGVD